MIAMAHAIVLLLGLLIAALSLWGLFVPQRLIATVQGVATHTAGIYAAIAVRLIMGAALLVAAPASRFPLVFEGLGWVAVLAAVGLAFLGRERLLGFIAWYEGLSPALLRGWLVFGLGFGVFLIYGMA